MHNFFLYITTNSRKDNNAGAYHIKIISKRSEKVRKVDLTFRVELFVRNMSAESKRKWRRRKKIIPKDKQLVKFWNDRQGICKEKLLYKTGKCKKYLCICVYMCLHVSLCVYVCSFVKKIASRELLSFLYNIIQKHNNV